MSDTPQKRAVNCDTSNGRKSFLRNPSATRCHSGDFIDPRGLRLQNNLRNRSRGFRPDDIHSDYGGLDSMNRGPLLSVLIRS